MPFLLVVLFIAVPIAELAVIIQVGQAIGVWWTIAILVADSILGSLLMRSQGRAVWRRFNSTLQVGRAPAREVADGVLVIFGGALLLTPGFLTDVLGLLLLLPPTRAVIRRLFLRQAMRRITVTMTAGTRAPRGGARRDDDLEGTAVDVDPRPGLGA
ncbi:MAG TPA: FxsA family protein [Solirubrobacteraceae bacterium]|nr:FxsA family protein [Solirubrobacteraceae bacterium]